MNKHLCNGTDRGYTWGMANSKVTAKRNHTTTTTKTKGRKTTTTTKAGAVTVTTKTKGNKVTTVRKGRPTPVTKVTATAVAKRYAEVIAYNKARGVKPPYRPSEAFLSAIVRAFSIPSMTEAGITTGKAGADARREFARAKRAGIVTADMVVHANHLTNTDGVGVFTDRPENTVRARLQGFCKVMGLPTDTLYAVRVDKYQTGELSEVAILRKWHGRERGRASPSPFPCPRSVEPNRCSAGRREELRTIPEG